MAKTVRRVITCMKEMFFDQSHENIRNACFISFFEILENCFINKRYGRENKKAKDLIIQPLFDELQSPRERVSRQSACYILRKLNEKYMQDPEVVNVFHCHTMVALGIKNKVYDGEFLMAVVDLLNEHGVGITLGECLGKAVPHIISSIRYNQTGQNASGKVHREQHLCSSLTLLAVLANTSINTEFAGQIIPKYLQMFNEGMALLNNESQAVLKIREQCINAWKKLEIHIFQVQQ